MAYVELTCQWVIMVVFGLAALAKARGRNEMATYTAALAGMGLVKPSLAGVVATAVVAVEVAVVALLAAPVTVPAGFVLAGITCVGFALGVTASIRRGTRIPCRCFGASSTPLGPAHVLRNIVLIGVACLGLSAKAVGGSSVDEAAGVLVAMVAAAVLVLIIRFLDEIVGVFAAPPATGR